MKALIFLLFILVSCTPKFAQLKYEQFVVIDTNNTVLVKCITCNKPIYIQMILKDSVSLKDTVYLIEIRGDLRLRKSEPIESVNKLAFD